jgi:hypothetical protein
VGKILKLISTYLAVDAEKEINISGHLRREILNATKSLKEGEDYNLTVPWESLFKPIQSSVYGTLAVDTFPRFVRSHIAQELYSKYLDETNICIPHIAGQYVFKDVHFHNVELNKHFAEQDILFAQEIVQDSFDWNLVYFETKRRSKSVMSAFYSNVKYFPKVSFLCGDSTRVAKFDYVLPYNLHDLYLQTTRDDQIDKMIHWNTCTAIDSAVIDGQEMKIGSFEMDCKLPFPLTTPRKYLFSSITWYDKKTETLYWMNKPILPKYAEFCGANDKFKFKFHTEKNGTKVKEMKCYLLISWQIFAYKKLSQDRTNLTQVLITNFAGWSNIPILFEKFLVQRCKEIGSFCVEAMEKPLGYDGIAKQVGLGKLSALITLPNVQEELKSLMDINLDTKIN